ncbi:MAG: enoyl-CoA hydratase/isomerase family protein [Thermodesulfobacteriota bacterium]
MSFQYIRREVADGVGTITLDRPPVNVLNIEMMEEINQALQDCKEEKGMKVLLFRANGKAFSAGVDVGEHMGDMVKRMIETFHALFRHMDELQTPSIAVVNGAALGGGCEMALYCDMVLATEKSTFGQPEVLVGVFPPIAALILPRIIGRKRAMELILSGKTIGARDALEMGLINRILAEDSLEEEVNGFVDEFTRHSAVVLKLTKKAAMEGLCDDVREGLGRIERIYLEELMKTEDASEGLKAFLEKRKPVWKDR